LAGAECHQIRAHSEQPRSADLRIDSNWEQGAQITLVKEIEVLGLCPLGHPQGPQDPLVIPLGEPVNEGKERMQFHREAPVGSGDEEPIRHAEQLTQELTLFHPVANVLNYGRGECDVELAVGKRQPVACRLNERHPGVDGLEVRGVFDARRSNPGRVRIPPLQEIGICV